MADLFQLEGTRLHSFVTVDGRFMVAGIRIHALLVGPLTSATFPTQYMGLRGQTSSGTVDLCLVAEADAPSGMGGVLKINKGGTDYAVYLVDTTDVNASPFRIRTTTGTKAIRLKT